MLTRYRDIVGQLIASQFPAHVGIGHGFLACIGGNGLEDALLSQDMLRASLYDDLTAQPLGLTRGNDKIATHSYQHITLAHQPGRHPVLHPHAQLRCPLLPTENLLQGKEWQHGEKKGSRTLRRQPKGNRPFGGHERIEFHIEAVLV